MSEASATGHRLPDEPEKVFAIDAEYLSGKRFDYQSDASLVEDVAPNGASGYPSTQVTVS